MPIKHVTDQIEAYIDGQLLSEERQRVEGHLAACPPCAQHLAQAQRVVIELGPTMHATLGRPSPPPALRYRIQPEFTESNSSPRFSFPWIMSGRLLNGFGTLAVIALLAVGAYAVIQGQIPGASILSGIDTLRPNTGGSEVIATATPRPRPTTIGQTTATAVPKASSSAGDTLPLLTPVPGTASTRTNPESALNSWTEGAAGASPGQESAATPPEPEGAIAFSFFNPAPDRQVYEIHLIDADGSNHRLFPLDGVSEPALRPDAGGYLLAYRAWNEPTPPRGLLTSKMDGEFRNQIGAFWEDAQPDWSPTENRLLFASQRESDRYWRLYTSWGDGTAEKELRREGKSPSFAPDGYNFVFEGCDDTGNRCGLWAGNLDDSEYGSILLHEDPLASSPDWSPAGNQIAYMANPDGNWDLYLIESDGHGPPRRLTSGPAIDGLPAWSPDGKWLAFLSDRGGNWGIWLLHLASGAQHQLFKFDGGTFMPPQRDPYGQRNWWDEQLSWSP